ncbi:MULTISPECIES: MotA/TolQ/ExbB proton channel family protein [Roseobacteraceae]|jgi:biopolymer transport protein ExbB|uniref:Biopolymer transport protein ExbB n=1 Tax=Pseudosulfitobacter pseudonitzschiae TaxID=1402135 RepID=A0A221JYJ7_9RHOB|nr:MULTISPECIES: MotA/TolQ/ExbB proton channel family protein [Roseobacteraceae]ASM71808.1 biopolymer transport protein ExbB [Pseudosulfitobacter pseudonitzschiae]
MILPPSLIAFLERGGPVLWLIAALSVLTMALILWKLWQLARLGAWSGAATTAALENWAQGDVDAARAKLQGRRSIRARMALAAMTARHDPALTEAQAREETTAHARIDLTRTRSGLRALELIATTAPLLGLLGTVVGMIDAFQALQEAGSRADPAALAGGIWEALLTTAAGMAVAIPAGVALTWFESIAARLQGDMETAATRVFTRGPKAP